MIINNSIHNSDLNSKNNVESIYNFKTYTDITYSFNFGSANLI